MVTEPIILIENLTKRYGHRTAVDGLNLSINSGEIFGFLGPNGAGKTTTLLMLLGLCQPSSGLVRVLGCDPLREPLKVKRQVGYLPENVGFYSDMTGRDNLNYVAELNGLFGPARDAKVREAFEAVDLMREVDKKVAAYSRGMRQRLGLAELLIKDPAIIFLDEPTLGLDPDGIDKMLALIKRLADQNGLTVVFSSHLLHLVARISTSVAILNTGVLLATGSIESLALATGLDADLEAIYRHYFQKTMLEQ